MNRRGFIGSVVGAVVWPFVRPSRAEPTGDADGIVPAFDKLLDEMKLGPPENDLYMFTEGGTFRMRPNGRIEYLDGRPFELLGVTA